MKYCGDSESPFVLPLQTDILSVKSGQALQAKTLVAWEMEGKMENRWRDGKYKSGDGGHDLITINGDTVTFGSFTKAKLKYGSFGPADARIVEMTGQSDYNVELNYNFVNKEMSDFGVILEDGTKLVLKGISGILTRIWISDEEAELIENDGDPIEAPTSPYKIEPERQGRLIWISGPPGLGKSTSAQLLSREHGFVYYEADCFFGLRNPYIPPDVENPTLATRMQRKLIGEGADERRKVSEKGVGAWMKLLKGEEHDSEVIEAGFKEMFKDIVRERTRLGGDWAIAGVLLTSSLRKIARTELGADLEIVLLEMTVEGQEERIRVRHDGNQHAVEMMRAIYDLVEPAEPNETKTKTIKVSAEMTPQHVAAQIIEG